MKYRNSIIFSVLIIALIVTFLIFKLTNKNTEPEETKNSIEENIPENTELFANSNHIAETLKLIPDFKPFLDSVEQTEIFKKLQDKKSQFTLFVPATVAFKDDQKQIPTESLVLHISEQLIPSSEFSKELEIPTLSGININLVSSEDGLFLKGPKNVSRIISYDLKSSNGVIHIVDTILQP